MHFSDSELKFVTTLRRYQGQWRWVRWLCLLGLLALAAMWASLLHRLLVMAEEESFDSIGAVAWLSPPVWAFLFMTLGGLGFVIAHWAGDMKTRLLLRLVEEHESPGTEPATSANAAQSGRFE